MIDMMDLSPEKNKKKEIELCFIVNTGIFDIHTEGVDDKTLSYNNYRLISKGDVNKYDVIACWQNITCDDLLKEVDIYLGHWNDGVRQ